MTDVKTSDNRRKKEGIWSANLLEKVEKILQGLSLPITKD